MIIAILTVAITGVVGWGGYRMARRAWYGFHRAVGISPHPVSYQPQHALLEYSDRELAQPLDDCSKHASLHHLPLTQQQLAQMPPKLRQQLERIDGKVASRKLYGEFRQARGEVLAATEASFILDKLLQQELPAMLEHYQQLRSISGFSTTDPITSPTTSIRHADEINPLTSAATMSIEQQDLRQQADTLMATLLDHIEGRLDEVILQHQADQLQHLQVMARYLRSRD